MVGKTRIATAFVLSSAASGTLADSLCSAAFDSLASFAASVLPLSCAANVLEAQAIMTTVNATGIRSLFIARIRRMSNQELSAADGVPCRRCAGGGTFVGKFAAAFAD